MNKPAIFRFKAGGNAAEDQGDWAVVGRVLKTVGLKGWLRIGLETDNPERFLEGARLFVRLNSGSPESVVVAEVKEHFSGNKLEVRFEGIKSSEQAARFVSALMVIPKHERQALAEGSFYSDELDGMEVIDPDGKTSGKVKKLESEVPSPYLIVISDKKNEVLVPFRKVFIKNIDRESAKIELTEPLSVHILED
jgi:16S rRNA processing protein RimM